MRLAIRHTTHYRFAEPIAHGLQRLRLTPKSTQGQHIAEWTMTYRGAREQLAYDDQNFNHVTLISAEPGTTEVEIVCEGIIDTVDNAGVLGPHAGHMPLWGFLGSTPLTKAGPHVRSIVAKAPRGEGEVLGTLHALSNLIREQVPYRTGVTKVGTTAEQALVAAGGVCQDHAHIFIAAARLLDIPARYVSGYLMMNDRVEQEATHAWAEAWVPNLGWVGFDISNGISPDPRYVRVATGRDYRDAAPVTGVSYGAVEQELRVQLAVEQQVVEQ